MNALQAIYSTRQNWSHIQHIQKLLQSVTDHRPTEKDSKTENESILGQLYVKNGHIFGRSLSPLNDGPSYSVKSRAEIYIFSYIF